MKRKTAKELLAESFRELAEQKSVDKITVREINYASLTNAVLRVSGLEALDVPTQMLIRVYVLGTVQITCEWVLGKYQVGPEALTAVYEAALPVPLRQYLTGK